VYGQIQNRRSKRSSTARERIREADADTKNPYLIQPTHTAQKLAATLLQRCSIAITVQCCRDIAKTLFCNIPAMLQHYFKILLKLR
jgi:hypothetical protein